MGQIGFGIQIIRARAKRIASAIVFSVPAEICNAAAKFLHVRHCRAMSLGQQFICYYFNTKSVFPSPMKDIFE